VAKGVGTATISVFANTQFDVAIKAASSFLILDAVFYPMTFPSDTTILRFLFAALVLGTLYRLYPIFAGQPELSQFFMTEDGYLMLTIARNMALGLGMTVSDGTISSNGVQPLATFLYALPYWVSAGDKVAGLIGVHLIATAISVAAIFSVRALARILLAPLTARPIWPWFVATLWYLGPHLTLHTMNGLETGLYTLMVTLTLVLFARILTRETQASLQARLVLGTAFGVTFLARNDGALLVTILFAVWLLHDLFVRKDALWPVVMRLFWPGVVSLLIAAPWLINNYVSFGSIVPISGTAQALTGGFAANAAILPANLFEQMFPMIPIPALLETRPLFMAGAVTVVVAFVALSMWQLWRLPGPARYVAGAYSVFGIALAVYYGFFFGAGWFLGRYLAPLSPLLISVSLWVLLWVLRRATPHHGARIARAALLGGVVVSGVLLGRYMLPGVKDQGHFQVVNWVTQNVPDDVWVGAIQTGTLGYWHDRTINLDGKVNPDALEEVLRKGHVFDYVTQSQITYLADWAGIGEWVKGTTAARRKFGESFELVLSDRAQNLAVLKRRPR